LRDGSVGIISDITLNNTKYRGQNTKRLKILVAFFEHFTRPKNYTKNPLFATEIREKMGEKLYKAMNCFLYTL